MIVFAHTKFVLFRIQESEVKRGGGGGGAESVPQSERVFEIPIRVGLILFRPVGGSLRIPQRLLSITLRTFELIL